MCSHTRTSHTNTTVYKYRLACTAMATAIAAHGHAYLGYSADDDDDDDSDNSIPFLIFVPCLPLLCVSASLMCSTGLFLPFLCVYVLSILVALRFFRFYQNGERARERDGAALLFDLKCFDTHYYHNRINRLMDTYTRKTQEKYRRAEICCRLQCGKNAESK